MKIKNVLGIIVSLLTIMLGGIALLGLLILSRISSDYFRYNDPQMLKDMLLIGGLFVATASLIIVGNFVLTKEQLKHTLKSTFLAQLLLISLVIMRISLIGQSDNFIFLFLGLVIIPILILQFLKKVNWTYIFATLYPSAIVIFVMLTSIYF